MKDCLDRLNWKTESEARNFSQWMTQYIPTTHATFLCDRCGRWHIVPKQALEFVKSRLKRERCVTTRELHLQMCRVLGVSLDELQARCDLSKVKIEGPGVQVVTLRTKSNDSIQPTDSGYS